jgi:hypothetical protein
MRASKKIRLEELEVTVTDDYMIQFQQADDFVTIHPAQAELVIECIRAALEAIKTAGKA